MAKFIPTRPHRKEIAPGQYRIRHGNRVPKDAVNLAYAFVPALSPEDNVHINDMSSFILENLERNEQDYYYYVDQRQQLTRIRNSSVSDFVLIDNQSTPDHGIQSDNFLVADVWDGNVPLYYVYQLKNSLYDAQGPDANGYYQGNAINVVNADGVTLSAPYYWRIKLRPINNRPGEYRVFVYTSFQTTLNSNFRVIYTAQVRNYSGVYVSVPGYNEILNPQPAFKPTAKASDCLSRLTEDLYYKTPTHELTKNYVYLPRMSVADTRGQTRFRWSITLEIDLDGTRYSYKSPVCHDYLYPSETLLPHEQVTDYQNGRKVISWDAASQLVNDLVPPMILNNPRAQRRYRAEADNVYVKCYTHVEGNGPIYAWLDGISGAPISSAIPKVYGCLPELPSYTTDISVQIRPKTANGSTLQVAFVIDNSASMIKADRAGLRSEIARQLINQLAAYYNGGPVLGKIEYSVYLFSDTVQQIKLSERDPIVAADLIAQYVQRPVGGNGATANALISAREFLKTKSSATWKNKAIVFITDSNNNLFPNPDASEPTTWASAFNATLVTAGIQIFTVGFTTGWTVNGLADLVKDNGLLTMARGNSFDWGVINEITGLSHVYNRNNCEIERLTVSKVQGLLLNQKETRSLIALGNLTDPDSWSTEVITDLTTMFGVSPLDAPEKWQIVLKATDDSPVDMFLKVGNEYKVDQIGQPMISLDQAQAQTVGVVVGVKEVRYAYTPLVAVRPLDQKPIRALPPIESGPQDSWYLRINNGSFQRSLLDPMGNPLNYLFFLPEYYRQRFDSAYGRPVTKIVNENPVVISERQIRVHHVPLHVDVDLMGVPTNLIVKINNVDTVVANWSVGDGAIELATNLRANDVISVTYCYQETSYIYHGFWDATNNRYWHLDLNPGPGHTCTIFDEADNEVKDVPSFTLINRIIYLYLRPGVKLDNIEGSSKEPHTLSSDQMTVDGGYEVVLDHPAIKSQLFKVYSDEAGTATIPHRKSVTNAETDVYWDWVDDPALTKRVQVFNPASMDIWIDYSYPSSTYSLVNNSFEHCTVFHSFKDVEDPSAVLLAKIYVRPNSNRLSVKLVDSRVRGGGLLEEIDRKLIAQFEPEGEFYWDIGYWDGQPYPENAVLVIKLPRILLKEFGGRFTKEEVETAIEKHIAYGVFFIVEYTHDPELILQSPDNVVIETLLDPTSDDVILTAPYFRLAVTEVSNE